MKYWIIIENRQYGPLTIAEIASSGQLRRDTPVWHEGLSEWVTAGDVEELAVLLRPPVPVDEPTAAETQVTVTGAPDVPSGGTQPRVRGNCWVQAAVRGTKPEPNNFLLWSILTTILCCIPTGIVAIIMSGRVSSRYAAGDYEGARKASRAAELWVVITITLGLVSAPFMTLLGML